LEIFLITKKLEDFFVTNMVNCKENRYKFNSYDSSQAYRGKKQSV